MPEHGVEHRQGGRPAPGLHGSRPTPRRSTTTWPSRAARSRRSEAIRCGRSSTGRSFSRQLQHDQQLVDVRRRTRTSADRRSRRITSSRARPSPPSPRSSTRSRPARSTFGGRSTSRSYARRSPRCSSAGYSVYGWPDLGFFDAIFNFKDKTDHFNSIIAQLYARQALAYLEDEPAYVTGIYKNAGVASYGPVPSVPPTPFTPADAVKTPYPYNPAKAVALLKSHGWKVVPNGQTTCAKPGSGAGECGAGIPAGTPFKFIWFYIPASETPSRQPRRPRPSPRRRRPRPASTSSSGRRHSTSSSPTTTMRPGGREVRRMTGASTTSADSPTTTTRRPNVDLQHAGTYNQGAYSNPTADSLINNSVFGSNPKAVTTEASYMAKRPPGPVHAQQDYILIAVSNKVGGPARIRG